MRRRSLFAAPLLALPLFATAPARAQSSYPSRPIQMYVPVAVAGASDVVGRVLADAMGPFLGKPMVIQNFAGAGSTIGAIAFERTAADGYSVFFATNNHVLMKAAYPQFPYDPDADFVPLSLASRQPFMLAVNPKLPITNVAELLAWLKKQGSSANFGASQPGANNYLAGQMFRQRTGVPFTIVPYKGAAAAVQDLVAGRVDFTIDSPTVLLPLAKSGLVRGIAVSTAEPSDLVPGLPSLQSQGVPDFDMPVWTILFAHPGTPPEVMKVLQDAAAKALALPETQKRFANIGVEVWPDGSPAAAAARVKGDIKRWAPIAAADGK
ncbi:MAG TPA: tripartite tricarboxylate transporter substrate binding protein [Arsenicitalea sp.]|nr:tripartite tricarboxylate transporter substrate binding protein [Arsenicitalea sp.]